MLAPLRAEASAPQIIPAAVPATALACRSLTKSYNLGSRGIDVRSDAVMAVHDVSLDIARGETFVIMGLSGSGKSTLLRCLSLLIPPTSGQVLVNGEAMHDASPARVTELHRHTMGMVFQHFALLPHLSVLGNVAFPLEIQGLSRRAREQRAMEMIDLVGLRGREQFFPRELSGGQQQRVGIARSLSVSPELWFLDEPFSALDPLIRTEMQDEFLRIKAHVRNTVVFITHDFDEALRIADRIAIMREGRVVQIGTPEELVLRPADDYVAAFTRKVPLYKVLRAGSLARPKDDAVKIVGQIAEHAAVAAAVAQLAGPGSGLEVLDTGGKVIGVVGYEDVAGVMMGRAHGGH